MYKRMSIVIAVLALATLVELLAKPVQAQGIWQGRNGPVELILGRFGHNSLGWPVIVFEVKTEAASC
jgi:hypothetical protein